MLKDIITGRRSVSLFKYDPIPKDLMDDIILMAGYAPSSCNTQPWYFVVFETEESKIKLNDFINRGYEYTKNDFKNKHKILGGIYSKCLNFFAQYGKFDPAPAYILVFARPYDTPVYSQAIKFSRNEQIETIAEDSVKTSAAMAIQNLCLYAHDNGLGTRVKDGIKFMLNFPDLTDEFYREFKIPIKYHLISGIQIGYPTDEAKKRTAPKRLSLDKIRKYI